MLTLNDVRNGVVHGKAYKRTFEDGGYEQITPLLPYDRCEFRYTMIDAQGEFKEWSHVAFDMLMDPNSGFGAYGWEEL